MGLFLHFSVASKSGSFGNFAARKASLPQKRCTRGLHAPRAVTDSFPNSGIVNPPPLATGIRGAAPSRGKASSLFRMPLSKLTVWGGLTFPHVD
jgi:hypothetical protein